MIITQAIPDSSRVRLSSSYEKYVLVNGEFERARMASDKALERAYRNHKAYFGVDFGQWDDKKLKQLQEEDRHPDQFNIVGPKVDTLAGSISNNKLDIDLKPIQGPRTSIIEAWVDSYMADREMTEFEANKAEAIKDAMIHSAEMKMVKTFDRTGLGNIAFRRCQPGFVISDPHWISNDDNDREKVWEIFHMSAMDVAREYNVQNQLIDNEIKMIQRYGGDYFDISIHRDPTQSIQRAYKGHLHRVIEYHYIDHIKTSRLQGRIAKSTRWVVFPMTKDKEALKRFMMIHKVNPHTMREMPYNDKVHMVVAICPDLSPNNVLTEGPSLIQPRRLPYYHLTANRSRGIDKGIVDDILDIQTNINEREMKISHLIGSANGGGKMVSDELHRTPEEFAEFKKRANDPSFVQRVSGDALRENPVHYLNPNQYPAQIINQIERMYDVVNQISKVPAAMEAMSENANESGVLFDRKLQVAQLGLITINSGVAKWEKDMGEGYLEQWQIDDAYNGWEREMSTKDNKHRTILNERVMKDGVVWVRNRPQDIPRSTVVVTESKDNPTKRLQDRAFFQELLTFAIQNNPQSLYVQFLFKKVLQTAEMNEKDKAEFDLVGRLQNDLDLSRVRTEIDNLDATSAQSSLAELQAMMEMESINQQKSQQPLPVSEVPESEIQQQSTIPQ